MQRLCSRLTELTYFSAFLLSLVISSHMLQAATPGVSLFNGKNLDGWVQRGGKAVYTVENGEIVGTSVPNTTNSFLCTDRDYTNFILDVDVKVDPSLNSGIQFRSNVYDQPKSYESKDKNGAQHVITVTPGRVHGYQAEIDPSSRAWSGGIYDEGRRGWLYSPIGEEKAQARAAFKNNEWNHYRIEANGPSIKVWVNNVLVTDLNDAMTSTGFIALQVHGIGQSTEKAGRQIRWKNITLQELPGSAQSATSAQAPAAPAAEGAKAEQWLHYPGKNGPGAGKKVVLISGDEEYRSEEALPQLAKILSQHHGFDCTVLFSIDPETGFVNPAATNNIPGTQVLNDADLMVIFTRFRDLPDEQMKPIDNYLKSGRPVLGIRTATHAFNPPANSAWSHYANGYQAKDGESADGKDQWLDGFGRVVLGERWHTHHGSHKHQSTRGFINPGAEDHPILRGIRDGEIWGSSDVYGVRLPLPGDSYPLILGQVVNRTGEYDKDDLFYGLRPTDDEADPKLNDPMMPIVWTKTYQVPGGKNGKSMTSTIGAAVDLLNEAVRKELVNGAFYLVGLSEFIPEKGCEVGLVGDYKPSKYEFRDKKTWNAAKKTVADFK